VLSFYDHQIRKPCGEEIAEEASLSGHSIGKSVSMFLMNMPDKDYQKSIDLESINSLVPRARSGDDDARNEICQQVQQYLQMMAVKQLDQNMQRKMNPSDVVQMTMTRMINGIDDFRGSSNAEFYGWLNQILRNEIKTSRRDLHRGKRDISRERELSDKSGNRPRPAITDPNLTPSSEAIKSEKLEQFGRALEKLPPDYAEVIQLRSLEELTFKEVAEKMGKSYNAVTKLWYRAVVKFQEELDRLDDSIL
jgi:RNA polymerase sigma-70 factor (subfamily 1)